MVQPEAVRAMSMSLRACSSGLGTRAPGPSEGGFAAVRLWSKRLPQAASFQPLGDALPHDAPRSPSSGRLPHGADLGADEPAADPLYEVDCGAPEPLA